jgi:hypothetical protein
MEKVVLFVFVFVVARCRCATGLNPGALKNGPRVNVHRRRTLCARHRGWYLGIPCQEASRLTWSEKSTR